MATLVVAGIAACNRGGGTPASCGAPALVKSKPRPAPPAPAPDLALAAPPRVPSPDLYPPPRTTAEILCREAWGARNPAGRYQEHEIKRLTLHHSGVLLSRNTKAPRRIRSAQRYHQSKARKWPDIAYHYLLDLEGNIYEGRPERYRGDTGTRYDTTGHFLVCLIGNYSKQEVTGGQVEALASLLAWASKTFDAPPATISGHRDHAATACPGDFLYALIKDGHVRRRVEEILAKGGARVRRICGEEARRRVAAVESGRATGNGTAAGDDLGK